jgi:hypothetical protein
MDVNRLRRCVSWTVLAAAGLALAASAGGCAAPAAVIQTLRAEQSLLAEDGRTVAALYDAQMDELQGRQAALKAAAFADLRARQNLEAEWAIATLRAADAGAAEVQGRIDVLAADRAVTLANLSRRQELLGRAIDLAVRSEGLNKETEELVKSLIEEAKK